MPNTHLLIQSATVGSGGASEMVFSNIPQTYTDLLLRTSTRNSTTTGEIKLKINGGTTNQTDKVAYFVGASTYGSNDGTSIRATANVSTSPANTFSSAEHYFADYTNTSINKVVSTRSFGEDNGTTDNAIYLGAGIWANTGAITSLTVYNSAGNMEQYSTAYLYGIKNS